MFISQKMTKIVCLYETHRPQRPPRHQEKPGTSAGAETAAEQAAEVHQCNYQINLSIGSFPVFRRRNTRVSLEVFPESELFGEAQARGNFFYRQTGLQKEGFCLTDRISAYPLHGSPPAVLMN